MYTILNRFSSLIGRNMPFMACMYVLLQCMTVSAQKPITIMGKYKGSMLTVKARTGTNSDVIESFTYAPYDKLQKDVEDLRKKFKNLEKENARLRKNLDDQSLMDSITTVTQLLKQKEREANEMRKEIENLTKSLNIQKNTKKDSLESLSSKVAELELRLFGDGLNTNSFSFDFSAGMASFVGSSGAFPLELDYHSTLKSHVSFVAYFSQTSPIAFSIGLGYGRYSFVSHLSQHNETINDLMDIDGDKYNAYRFFNNVEESLALGYLEIPISLHVGNNHATSSVSLWGEVGATLGLNVRNVFEGKGTYSCEGYYPQWNVTIQDIPFLGFVENSELYNGSTKHDVNSLLIWGSLAAGIYAPIGSKIGLDLGGRVAFTLNPICDKGQEDYYVLEQCNMLQGEKKRLLEYGVYVKLTYKF